MFLDLYERKRVPLFIKNKKNLQTFSELIQNVSVVCMQVSNKILFTSAT